VFAGLALNQAKPKMVAERVPGHPDTFELWNEGPGRAVIVRADVVSYRFPQGAPITDARAAIPGLWVDERLLRDREPCHQPSHHLPGSRGTGVHRNRHHGGGGRSLI
jgi:hypothetical protein